AAVHCEVQFVGLGQLDRVLALVDVALDLDPPLARGQFVAGPRGDHLAEPDEPDERQEEQRELDPEQPAAHRLPPLRGDLFGRLARRRPEPTAEGSAGADPVAPGARRPAPTGRTGAAAARSARRRSPPLRTWAPAPRPGSTGTSPSSRQTRRAPGTASRTTDT